MPVRDQIAATKAVIDAAVADAQADASEAKQEVATARSELQGAVATAQQAANDAKADAATVRTDLIPQVDAAKQAAADAATQAAQASASAAQVRTDLVPTIADAKKAGTDAAAAAGQIGSDLAAEVTRAKGAEGTLTTKVETAQGRADGAHTAIGTETTQRVQGDTALSQRIDTVESTAASDKGTINSRITSEVTTLTNADTALGQRIDSLTTTVNGNTTTLVSETKARSDADTALGQRIDTLTTTVGGNTTAISSEATARSTADGALGQRIDSVVTQANTDRGDYTAKISDEATARSNADGALATRAASLEARAQGGGNLLLNTAFAGGDYTGWTANGPAGVDGRGVNQPSDDWHPRGDNVLTLHQNGRNGSVGLTSGGAWNFSPITVTQNQHYQFYAFVAAHRARVEVSVQWFDANGADLGSNYTGPQVVSTGGRDIEGFTQIGFPNATAPSGATFATLWIGKWDTNEGQSDSWMWFLRPYAGSVRADQQAWNPYVAGDSSAAVRSTALAKIADEATTRANADGAISNRVQIIEADYTTNGAAANIAQAKVNDEATTRANADGALSNRLQTIEADYTTNGTAASIAQAKVNDEATARANADGALANRTTSIEASYGAAGGALDPNPTFSVWPDGQPLPSYWSLWNGGDVWRVAAGKIGNVWAARVTTGAGANGGLAQWTGGNALTIPAGWYVLEAEVSLESGSWRGSGLSIHGQANLDFAREADTNGVTSDTQAGSRHFSKLVNLTYTAATNWHLMNAWDGFAPTDAKTLTWYRAIVRPASGAEILAQTANVTANAAQARINDEATARSNADGALATRTSGLETRMGSQENFANAVNAKVDTNETASVNRDTAIATRATTLESKSTYLNEQVAKAFPGFETRETNWGFDTQQSGRNQGAGWEANHVKGAGISFGAGAIGSYLYMDPNGWIKTTPGKRYRAGFWVWQWSAPNGYGGAARVYWEGHNAAHTESAYLGSTANPPEATQPFYGQIPNGAWHCYASDLQMDDNLVSSSTGYWVRPRINIDGCPANAGYVIAGWFFREVTGEYDNAAKISDEATTRSNQDSALANRISSTEAKLNGTEGSWMAGRIVDEATASTNRDGALGNRLNTIEATVYNGPNQNSTLSSRITDEATASANRDSALANRASALEARQTNSGNLVANTAFATTEGWFLNYAPNGAILDRNRAGAAYMIGGVENNLTMYQSAGGGSLQAEILSERFAVQAGEFYQVYALTSNHRCRAWVTLFFYDANGGSTGYAGENFGARMNAGGQDINTHDITGNKCVQAPPGTVSARFGARMYDVSQDGYVWVSRPYVGLVKTNTTEWNAYSPGSDRLITSQVVARIGNEETARATADSALGNRSSTLEAQMAYQQPSGMSGAIATVDARVNDEATVRSTADSALATRISTTESQFAGTAGSALKTLLDNNRRNMIDLSWWKKGAGIPWGLNGGAQNVIYSLPDGGNDNIKAPDGGSGDVWLAQADAGGGAAGGWNAGPFAAPLDPDKTYRFILPIAHLGAAGRQSYWGTEGVCILNTTTGADNPYWAIASNGNMTPNRWYLFVGYIFPRNSSGKSHDGAGVYDTLTGDQIVGGSNYCFRPDGAQPVHRAYQYYAQNGAYQAFGRPIVECCDGSESDFRAALNAAKSATSANARITDEATTRSNADSALSGRISTTESMLNLGTDSNLYARVRTEETTRANADGALSSRSTALEANAVATSGSSLVKNNRFSMWSDGNELPNGWSWWIKGATRMLANRELSPGASGGYTVLSIVDANQEHGWMVSPINVRDGWFVMEAEIELLDGNLQGAGLTLSGVYNLDFARDPDVNGTVSGSGFYRRRFSKLFQATIAVDNFHCMQGWSGFAPINYHYIRWFSANVRPATDGEIKAQKATADLVTANARIGSEETTRANADGALSNRLNTAESMFALGTDSSLYARLRTEETTRSNADSAISSRTSVVEAQVSNDSNNLLRNGIFNAPGWGGGLPPYWGLWSQDNGAFIGPSGRASRYGAPAPLQIDRNGINNGVTQAVYNLAPGWYVFDVDITGEDGNWSGSGIHCNFNNGYSVSYGFATNADTAGRFGDIGTANRQFSTMFYNGANSTQANFYLMSGWSGFQGETNFGFFRGVWHRVVMRQATDAEIKAQKVIDSNVMARVSTTESAISTLNGKASAYWQVQAVAGNGRAQMTVHADANGGGGVDIVGDVAITGSDGNGRTVINQYGVFTYYPNGNPCVKLGRF